MEVPASPKSADCIHHMTTRSIMSAISNNFAHASFQVKDFYSCYICLKALQEETVSMSLHDDWAISETARRRRMILLKTSSYTSNLLVQPEIRAPQQEKDERPCNGH